MKCCAIRPAVVLLALAAAAPAELAAPMTEDFETIAIGAPPDAFMVIEGGWGIVEVPGNRMLELHAEPVVDAAILIGPSLKEAASIRARFQAAKSRRAHPRMGVGLYGVSGVKVRLAPAQKKLELLVGEESVAEVAFDAWTENSWWQIELKVSGSGTEWTAEARVWPENAPAPVDATLSKTLATPPGQGRASLIGSPYANKPIHFDTVTVAGGK